MIRIITPYYNAEAYLKTCIDSVLKQYNQDWTMYLINDMSTDNSYEIACSYSDPRIINITNDQKLYQVGNYYTTLQRAEIETEDIIVLLDGDDWLHNNCVFDRLQCYYSKDILAAFGNFVCTDGTIGWTANPCDDWTKLRHPSVRFTATHLRTCKAHLMRAVSFIDLVDDECNYYDVTGDLAYIYPMLEMAGKDRVLFTNDINMVYNIANPLSDYKAKAKRQRDVEFEIRKKPPYKQWPDFNDM